MEERTIKKEFDDVVAVMMKATEMLHNHHFYVMETHAAASVDPMNQIMASELYEWFLEDWVKKYRLNPSQHHIFYEMLKAFVDKHMILVQLDTKHGHDVCIFRVTQIQFSLPTVDDPYKAPNPRRICIMAGCGNVRWAQYDEMYQLAVQDFVFETHEAVGVKDEDMAMKNSQLLFAASYRIRDVSNDQETVPSNQTTNC